MTLLLLGVYYTALLVFIVPRIRTAHNRQRVLTWPQTKAILEPRVALHDKGASSSGVGAPDVRQVQGHLQEPFIYYVGGQKYEGRQVEPGFERQHQHYRNMARFYLMRRTPTVFFNPQDPTEAYLQPGQDPLSWRVIGWGGLVLGAWPVLLLL